MPAGAGMRIDKLRLELPGGSASDARKVAALVAARLAEADMLPEIADLSIPSLRIDLKASHGDPERIAREISAQILRALLQRT